LWLNPFDDARATNLFRVFGTVAVDPDIPNDYTDFTLTAGCSWRLAIGAQKSLLGSARRCRFKEEDNSLAMICDPKG
jgi:hypothetical protein